MKTIYLWIRVTAFFAFMIATLAVLVDGNVLRTLVLLLSLCLAVCGVLLTCICDMVLEREHLTYLKARFPPKKIQAITDVMRDGIYRERITLMVTYMFSLFLHFVIIHFALLEKLS